MSDKRLQAKKMAKILALIPVVSLAAACNGLAPTVPSELLPSNDSGDASAMSLSTGNCEAVTGIDLHVVDSSRTYLWVEATYQYINSGLVGCPAPTWSSDRDGLVVDERRPFRAGFQRSTGGRAVLTATALNGVHNSIRLDLGDSPLDFRNDPCLNIVSVDLQVLPSASDKGVVSIQAKYVFLGETAGDCRAPPSFKASRPGLRIDPRDPFRAEIASAPRIKTTVGATAPNGVGHNITF
jgi:hypothetical protein